MFTLPIEMPSIPWRRRHDVQSDEVRRAEQVCERVLNNPESEEQGLLVVFLESKDETVRHLAYACVLEVFAEDLADKSLMLAMLNFVLDSRNERIVQRVHRR